MPFGVVLFKKSPEVGFFVGCGPANERGALPKEKKRHNFPRPPLYH
jgi:hypothetical protein